jgi:hypothetical protein
MNLAPIRNIDIQPVRSQATEILQQILENNARKEEMAFRKTEQDARLSELNRKAMAEKRLQEALNVPTTREQTVQDPNAFNFLAREGADPSQFTTSERVPVPESDRMKQQIKNLVSIGDIQGAKQLQDIYEKQKDDQEAGVTYQYYLKNPSGWKQDMIRDFPDRAEDINNTSFTPDGRTLIYNDKERGGFWSRDVRTGKEEFKAYQKPEKPEEKWTDPYEAVIGGKKMLLRKNLATNKTERVGEDKSTTVIIDKDKPPSKKDSITLRKEFNSLPEVKESNLIMPKINSMERAYKESFKTNNFVAVDQALVTLYNKLTDPSSVVRESEYARTAMNEPLLNQIQGKVSKVLYGGAGLTTSERSALIRMARLMKQGYQEIRSQRIKEYRKYADDYGFKGEDVIADPYEIKDKSTSKKPLSQY